MIPSRTDLDLTPNKDNMYGAVRHGSMESESAASVKSQDTVREQETGASGTMTTPKRLRSDRKQQMYVTFPSVINL